jgi:hypothetical protein
VTGHSELLVLAGSHYSERVLWAFEATALPVRINVLAPGPHVLHLRRVAPGLTRTTLPVWLRPCGALQGSDAILTALNYPAMANDAEARLVHRMGPRVRHVFYAGLCQQPNLAAAWASRAYATSPFWLGRLAGLAPRLLLRALLLRERVHLADIAGCLQALRADAAALTDVAEDQLTRLAAGPHQPLSRFTLTCGALLGPLLLPVPDPWQLAPASHAAWSPDLSAQVQDLQDLALWRLAHAAWWHRQQTAKVRRPDRDGAASAPPQIPQTPAHGPATGGQGSA